MALTFSSALLMISSDVEEIITQKGSSFSIGVGYGCPLHGDSYVFADDGETRSSLQLNRCQQTCRKDDWIIDLLRIWRCEHLLLFHWISKVICSRSLLVYVGFELITPEIYSSQVWQWCRELLPLRCPWCPSEPRLLLRNYWVSRGEKREITEKSFRKREDSNLRYIPHSLTLLNCL